MTVVEILPAAEECRRLGYSVPQTNAEGNICTMNGTGVSNPRPTQLTAEFLGIARGKGP